jgi:hypothetical protein
MVNLNINLNKKEVELMWHDIIKYLTIAITIHLLFYVVDDEGQLFGEYALKFFLYLVLGLIIYYLIVKKAIDKYFTKEPKGLEKVKTKKRKHRKVKKPKQEPPDSEVSSKN